MDRATHNSKNSLISLLICSLFLSGAASTASAAEPGSGSALGWFTFTPRLWVSAVDTIDFDNLVKDIFVVPMAGISITMAPPVIPDLSFAFTVLGGEADGDAVFTGFANPEKVDGEVTRLDIELLLRYQIPDSPFSIFVGPRFTTFDEEYQDAVGDKLESQNDAVLLQFGLGAASDLGTSGRHRLFANAMTGVAFIDATFKINAAGVNASDKTEEPMFDLNAGYQYIYNDIVSLSMRYRLFMIFSENDFGFDDTFLVHGPEFGVTARFN